MSMAPEERYGVRILVVDDEPANVRLLERILRRDGYTDIRTTTRSSDALASAATQPPDIVLLDLHMPELNGVEVIRGLRSLSPWTYPLVVVLTGDASAEAKADVLSAGAKDFITKPFDTAEVLLRIRNLADLRVVHNRLQQANEQLEEKVRQRTAELEEARLDVLDRLAMASEFRDDTTGQHTRRVGAVAEGLARILGLPDSEVELIARAAPLHDLGKIAIPDRILLKPGPLDDAEVAIMRTHTTVGAKLLSPSRSPLLMAARDVALSHHERWDGRGYPYGLVGKDIPLAGRIVALSDFFDAMTHDRPYRAGHAVPDVLDMIKRERGSHFDPEVVDAFLEQEPLLLD